MRKQKQKEKVLTVKIIEAYTRDVGRGVARIDYDTMDKLDISTGDVIELKYKTKVTPLKALPLYPSDENKNLIRTDGLERDQVNVKIGSQVQIKKTKCLPATHAKFLPLEDVPPIDGRYLSDVLESYPTAKGQKVMIPYFGGRLSFKVTETKPPGFVVITQHTESTIIQKGSKDDVPEEIQKLEKKIIQETNKVVRDSKKEIKKLLKEKNYDKALETATYYQEKLAKIKESFEKLKEIMKMEEKTID